MANLVVSRVCNLKCSYCFAENYFQKNKLSFKSPFISLEAFEHHLDFLERSGINEIRLIGGEPTLHPQFAELILRARARGRHIIVFSNGLLSEPVLDSLLSLPPETCTILVNMNTAEEIGSDRLVGQRRQDFLRLLGPRAVMSYTICNPSFDLLPIQDALLEAGCRKIIRLGLAHPTMSAHNEYLNPKQYPIVGHKIASFASIAAKQAILLDLDCGFIRCMFSDEDLDALNQARANIGWHCNPILDIDLDQTAIFCFPLEDRAKVSLNDGLDATELRAHLAAQVQVYDSIGIYKECSVCSLMNGECTGGCLANRIKRFRPANFSLRVSMQL
jgi:hypothetical protein